MHPPASNLFAYIRPMSPIPISPIAGWSVDSDMMTERYKSVGFSWWAEVRWKMGGREELAPERRAHLEMTCPSGRLPQLSPTPQPSNHLRVMSSAQPDQHQDPYAPSGSVGGAGPDDADLSGFPAIPSFDFSSPATVASFDASQGSQLGRSNFFRDATW